MLLAIQLDSVPFGHPVKSTTIYSQNLGRAGAVSAQRLK
jgi:hypothetical protein